jgi:hypothetical protein
MWGRFGSVRFVIEHTVRGQNSFRLFFSRFVFSSVFRFTASLRFLCFRRKAKQSKANKKKDGRKERDFVKDYTIYDTTDFKKSNTFRFDFNFNFNSHIRVCLFLCHIVLRCASFSILFFLFFFSFFFPSYLFNTTILTHIRISFYLLPPILFFFFCGQF